MRKLTSTLLLGAALGLVAGPASAQFRSDTTASGTGYFITSTAQPCVGSTVAGCAMLTVLNYDSAGLPQALTSKGSDITGTYYAGSFDIGGTVRLDTPNTVDATITIGSGSALALARTVIETGRPGGAFNTIATGFYAPAGATKWEWALEVQGSTLFGARRYTDAAGKDRWQFTTGKLVLNAANATSSYSDALMGCTVGPACTSNGTVSFSFPRNNIATVTLPDGSVSSLQPFAY
jgi:hypothetical protein